ncbi:MAG TPA: glycoside hydrolase family 30 protein [Candidatus Fimivicinus intestinavium]|nr:glycoside hydrolase family 30 protein [Candidatus Fimivicinus intestinavium]
MKIGKQILAAGLSCALLAGLLSSCVPSDTATLTIDPTAQHQTMESFGVSSAWWSQDVGGWTNLDENGVPVREAIMEMLYGDTGLGLQVYRYNLGAGTGTGEKAGTFNDPWRSAQSFIDDDGNIDYTLDANALWCMNRALELGASEVVFFSNSAPDTMTINGKPHSDEQKDKVTNLAPENYQAFTDYVLDAVEHFRAQGVPITIVSPINEPQWTWQGGQEGCHFEPDEMVAFYKVFYAEMEKRGLADEIELGMFESGQWGGNDFRKWFKAIMEDETLSKVMTTIEAHSYNSSASEKARTDRWLDKNYPSLKRRCTEWTEMEDLGRDVGMDSAVVMADMICTDLTVLDAVHWSYWLAVSCYDWRDGLLYVDLDTHTYTVTKRLYEYGNFTKFILPGAVRVDTQLKGKDVNAVSFDVDGQLVTVLVNSADEAKTLSLEVNGSYQAAQVHLTDETHNLEQVATEDYVTGNQVKLPAKSVMTLVMDPA